MRRLASLCIILIFSLPVSAGDHQHVAWDALEPGKAYMIRTEVHSQAFYQTTLHGVVRFPGGGFFKVYERVMHEGALWYGTKWVKPRSLDPNDNIEGWMKAAELREHGAYVIRGYD